MARSPRNRQLIESVGQITGRKAPTRSLPVGLVKMGTRWSADRQADEPGPESAPSSSARPTVSRSGSATTRPAASWATPHGTCRPACADVRGARRLMLRRRAAGSRLSGQHRSGGPRRRGRSCLPHHVALGRRGVAGRCRAIDRRLAGVRRRVRLRGRPGWIRPCGQRWSRPSRGSQTCSSWRAIGGGSGCVDDARAGGGPAAGSTAPGWSLPLGCPPPLRTCRVRPAAVPGTVDAAPAVAELLDHHEGLAALDHIPLLTTISATVPSFVAAMWFSIFIASRSSRR